MADVERGAFVPSPEQVTSITVYPGLVGGEPTVIPVTLEGRLTVDGPHEPGPLTAWVPRG